MAGVLYDMMPMPRRRPDSDVYRDLLSYLSEAFQTRYATGHGDHTRLTGLIFGRPEHPLVRDSILPSMEYYHLRSGKNVDFFFAGFRILPSNSETEALFRTASAPWWFDNGRFNQMRRRFEEETKWKYSGGVDLILTNARYSSATKRASLEFDTAILCRLGEMVSSKTISSVEVFFEDVFRHAEQCSGLDSTWGLSDKMGTAVVGSGIKKLILSLLPKKSGEDAAKLAHFAVRDLAKKS